jgi:hypothetical protein
MCGWETLAAARPRISTPDADLVLWDRRRLRPAQGRDLENPKSQNLRSGLINERGHESKMKEAYFSGSQLGVELPLSAYSDEKNA